MMTSAAFSLTMYIGVVTNILREREGGKSQLSLPLTNNATGATHPGMYG